MARGLIAAFAALVCLFALRTSAHAEGALVVRSPDGREEAPLPLVRTTFDVSLSGSVSSVSVTQRFHNSFARPIEAVYVFPLPTDSAVDAMEMRIRDRVVRAVIRRRGDARRQYEAARDHGQRAALLEQERPNIFTFNVANIDPGADIDVSVHFFGTARYDHNTYELALPMVVGPRYIPGTPSAEPPTGTGSQPDTDRVRDASRISPAYVPPGTRSGHAVSLRAHVDAGSAVDHIECPAHDVSITRASPNVFDVSLRDKDEIPNRDFVLRWKLSAPELRASVLTHRRDAQHPGYLALTLEPRHDAPSTEIAAREIVFLLDTSGSMMGRPLDAVKSAITRALASLSPNDTFQIIDFADTASSFAPRALAATPDNITRGQHYLHGLQSSGGTNQLAGIHAALSAPRDPMRLRYVVFMTDGYIGNEAEVLALTHREIADARIFSFGVGASVNRFLLEEVAHEGRGHAEVLSTDEDPAAMVERFYTRIGRPWLTDLRVDYGSLPVRDTLPAALPDLSALQPLVVFARYDRGASGTVTIRGTLGGRPYEQTLAVALPETSPSHSAIGSLWARQRIAALSRAEHLRPDDRELVDAITDTALEHHLMSQHTSFVAVDDTPTYFNGRGMRIDQPAEAPRDVDLGAAGGVTLAGSQIGDAFGAGGLGLRGTGWGGGGTGHGTIGLGSFGTIGHGAGTGAGQGYGSGSSAGLRGRGASAPAVRVAPPQVMGSLSPDAIRRVVLRNVGQVQRCYELGLARNPALSGRIAVRFVIDALGHVLGTSTASQALGDASVVECINAAIRRWVFPAPAGGGTVTVTYPFVLQPPATPAGRR